MTVQRAIELLTAMKEKHGDVEVFFDCQHCGKSTRPEIVVAVAMIQKAPTR
jgi:hypothetical protein